MNFKGRHVFIADVSHSKPERPNYVFRCVEKLNMLQILGCWVQFRKRSAFAQSSSLWNWEHHLLRACTMLRCTSHSVNWNRNGLTCV